MGSPIRISPGGAACSRRAGYVDGVTTDEAVTLRVVVGDHLARVDTDPSLDADAPLEFEIEVHVLHRLLHLDGGPRSAESIVLVDRWNTERRHHGVSDELLDRAAVAHEDLLHLVEIAGDHAAEGLRIHLLAESRGTRQVAEDQGHGLPCLGRDDRLLDLRSQRGSAVLTELGLLGVLFSAVWTGLHGP